MITTTTTRTVNDEGVTTITVGDEASGFELTVVPDDGNDIGVTVGIEGRGSAAIADGGLRLDTELAARLATALFGVLTG